MRLFNRKMIGEFALNLNYGPEPDTISFLIHQGARVAEVQVTIDDRTAGESYLKPVTAVKYNGSYALIHSGDPEISGNGSRMQKRKDK